MRAPVPFVVSLLLLGALPAFAQYRVGGGFGGGFQAGGGGYPAGGGGYPGGGGGYPGGGGSGMGGVNTMQYPTGGSYYYPGFGYSSRPLGTTPYGYGYGGYPGGGYGFSPMTGVPVPLSGGFYRMGSMPFSYWQSPSGFYYPWTTGATQQTIYQFNQNSISAAQPPLDTMLSDLETYLNNSKKNNQLATADYQHLFRRLHDLQAKYHHEMTQEDGMLDLSEEARLRAEINALGTEIATRVKPLPK